MGHWNRLAVMTVLLLVTAVPALASSRSTPAATPHTAMPEPGPGIQVEILADTADVPMAASGATPEPAMQPLDHRLARITMRPGASFTGPVLQSAIVYVDRGSIKISPVDAAASVNVGDGEPILAAADGNVVCEIGICDIEPGQAVVLGAGNSLSSVMDSLEVEVAGHETVVLQLSAVLMEGHHPLCWICPGM